MEHTSNVSDPFLPQKRFQQIKHRSELRKNNCFFLAFSSCTDIRQELKDHADLCRTRSRAGQRPSLAGQFGAGQAVLVARRLCIRFRKASAKGSGRKPPWRNWNDVRNGTESAGSRDVQLTKNISKVICVLSPIAPLLSTARFDSFHVRFVILRNQKGVVTSYEYQTSRLEKYE